MALAALIFSDSFGPTLVTTNELPNRSEVKYLWPCVQRSGVPEQVSMENYFLHIYVFDQNIYLNSTDVRHCPLQYLRPSGVLEHKGFGRGDYIVCNIC